MTTADGGRGRTLAVLLVVVGGGGCGGVRSCGTDTAIEVASPSPSSSPEEVSEDVAVPPLFDPETREPLALQRIAETHRATVLMSLAESRRPESAAALLALEYADDVEVVADRLARLALERTHPGRRGALLVLRAFAYRRPRSTERLAPESLAACVEKLRRLAGDAEEEPALRGLASTCVRGMERAGLTAASPETSATSRVEPVP